jgi:hypothetical protein
MQKKYQLSFGLREDSTVFIRCALNEFIGFNMLASFGRLNRILKIRDYCTNSAKLLNDSIYEEECTTGYEFLRIYNDRVFFGYYVNEYMAKDMKLIRFLDEGECVESEIPIQDFINMINCYIEFLMETL